MKLTDMRPCDNCGSIYEIGMFYVLHISLAVFKPDAVNQVMGLYRYFQGQAIHLAEMFAPDPDIVIIAGEEDPVMWTRIFLCQDCFMGEVRLAHLVEKVNEMTNTEER